MFEEGESLREKIDREILDILFVDLHRSNFSNFACTRIHEYEFPLYSIVDKPRFKDIPKIKFLLVPNSIRNVKVTAP